MASPNFSPPRPRSACPPALTQFCLLPGDSVAVTFYEQSTFTPDSVRWDFGDGSPHVAFTTKPDSVLHFYTTPGVYPVTYYTFRPCVTDTVRDTIYIFAPPALDIGYDTSVCAPAALSLNATPGMASYSWSTGDSLLNIVVNTSGIYFVEVTDSNGCVNSDTMQLTVYPQPSVALGADINTCAMDTVLMAIVSDSSASLLWNTSATTDSITVTSSGTYYVAITDSNGCTDSDTVLVALNAGITLDLGNDTTVCSTSSFTLTSGSGFASQTWSTGDTTPSITVTASGTYYVDVTDSAGCTGTDTILVNFFAPLTVALPSDTSFCEGDSILLTAFVSDPGASLLWNTGETSASIYIDTSGVFSITATNQCDTVTASTNVLMQTPPQSDLGPDQSLCGYQTITLSGSDPLNDFLWSTGDSLFTINIMNSGTYWIREMNACGVSTDTITVEIIAEDSIFIPNVFSPNGDGLNDFYQITVLNPEHFELHILNRWGNLLFETSDPAASWNGTFNGQDCQASAYVYIVRAMTCGGEIRTYTGVVTLLR